MLYLLTPWSRVFLEKLTGSAASQEIPHIFGTRRFITVFKSARHLSLSWANSIQSPQPPPTSWRSILILFSHLRLGLPNGLFPSGFPTRTLCTPLPSQLKYCMSFKIISYIWTARSDSKLMRLVPKKYFIYSSNTMWSPSKNVPCACTHLFQQLCYCLWHYWNAVCVMSFKICATVLWMSSVDSKCCLFTAEFNFWNKKKSQGARSGE